MDEEWRPIRGYEGRYEVSNVGRVRSSYKRQGFDGVRHLQRRKAGYVKVDLGYKGAKKTFDVHRLVAEAFIPNPANKTDVNHINGDKGDNRVSNLEWATRAENMAHSHEVLGRGGRPKRAVRCIETDRVFSSLHEAVKETGVCLGALHCALNGKYQTAGGSHWEYAN